METEFRALHLLGKCSTIELHLQPLVLPSRPVQQWGQRLSYRFQNLPKIIKASRRQSINGDETFFGSASSGPERA